MSKKEHSCGNVVTTCLQGNSPLFKLKQKWIKAKYYFAAKMVC